MSTTQQSLVRFIHTADWQIGKPFGRITDLHKRSLLQQERIDVIHRIGQLGRAHKVEFVLVAGDLFDSTSVTKATVSAACSAIGQIGVPVIAIPGNHDHGGVGSLWEQEYFQREQSQLAPNFRILLRAEPVEIGSTVIFPCPLLRRSHTSDPTAWLRTHTRESFPGKTRVVLAHGSTQDFTSQTDGEEREEDASSVIEIDRLPSDSFDYIALGDWHGTKEVSPRAWYAGTPEADRFTKGSGHDPGNVLVVEVSRNTMLRVTKERTARFRWHEHSFAFADDASLSVFKQQLDSLLESRTQEDLLRLHLSGSLGIQAATELDQYLEAMEARLLRVKLQNLVVIAPTQEEIESLAQRQTDPLISRVAIRLLQKAKIPSEAEVARIALRRLYNLCETKPAGDLTPALLHGAKGGQAKSTLQS